MKGSLDIVGGNLIDGKADRPRLNCSLRVKDGRIGLSFASPLE